VYETTLTIIGWMGTDVTLERAGKHSVATFRLATTPDRWRRGEWVKGPTSWYRVKAWRALAEHAASSLHRGDPVVVHGRLSANLWEREDGVSVTTYEVVATSIGHDLTFGESVFTRAAASRREEGAGARSGATSEASAEGRSRAGSGAGSGTSAAADSGAGAGAGEKSPHAA
jgi:single-strand DNA-binding protein